MDKPKPKPKPKPNNRHRNAKCKEPNCTFSSRCFKELRKHLEMQHQISQEVDELFFENKEDFLAWKAAEEQSCMAYYVKRLTTQSNATMYYHCNGGGTKRVLDSKKRIRKIRVQKSKRMACPSAITVKTVLGGVKVEYYKTHYGHCSEGISQDVKDELASQIVKGIPFDEIMHIYNTRRDYNSTAHPITKKVLYNIMREYDISNPATCYHANRPCYSVTRKVKWINRCHDQALEAKDNMLVMEFQDSWNVVSGDTAYSINRNVLSADHTCKIECRECATCIHAFSCNCDDFVINDVMCEHVHRVCMSMSEEKRMCREERVIAGEEEEETSPSENEAILSEEEEKEKLPNVADMLLSEIRRNINIILESSDWLDSMNQEKLKNINNRLLATLNLLSGDPGLCPGEADDVNKSKDWQTLSTKAPSTLDSGKSVTSEKPPPVNYCVIIPPQVPPANVISRPLEVRKNVPEILQSYPPIVPKPLVRRNEDIKNKYVAKKKAVRQKTSKILKKYRPIMPAQILTL